MSLLRSIARPMLGGMFVYGGIDALRDPKSKATGAATVAPKVADLAGVDADPVDVVRITGAVQVAGGLMLVLGVLPRVAATALAGSLIPTTLADHRFWEQDDPSAREQQLTHFLKNAATMGGLLMVVSAGK